MAEQNKIKHVIPKKALYHAAFNWETWVQCCYNYERMMGMACGHTFVPVINYLYKDDPDGAAKRKEIMEREMEFFNVHIEFGSCILGMAIALEEQKSLGEPIPGDFITSLKTSLMGPLAGIGDTIYQGVLIPILLAICIDITLTGTVWGSIAYLILMLAISYVFSFANFFFGYQQGSDAIMDFLEKGVLDKLLLGAQVMGCMVMGGLIANYVTCSCGLEIVTSGSTFNVQETLFDAVMPKILPLGFTMLVYWLMKKRWTSIKIIILIVIIGVVGGLTGILTA
ncbi:MAG: PTS system mannose/fructose/sorbose family transporter subunit IID [Faecalicoccus sp.]|uniref:PTS system mannose/fructose/sorbose family transporter subunit IID n=1 Tax=Faecalicoccus sp. TaxID=1971758 RepID=UPI002A91CA85|nr:PTS system mannose/fructose/sorbose family transporter subunit IID [Faecalicoccus sp.]MDY5232576.1 PTS system mannose/fructose/sorbose family transporter subunit IID [Faecalicoccus sp.]